MRRAALILLLLLPVTILAGCARLSGDYMNSSKNRKAAIKKLNEQFDTEFTYVEDWAFPVGSGDVFGKHSGVAAHIYVKCEELPDVKIAVSYSDDGTVASNYIQKLYEEETVDRLTEIVNEVYASPTVRICLKEESVTRDFDSETTLEDFLASGCLQDIKICTTDNEGLDTKFRQLNDLLIAGRISCTPFVYSYDEDVYSHGEDHLFDLDNVHVNGVSRLEKYSPTLDEDYEYGYEFYEYTWKESN